LPATHLADVLPAGVPEELPVAFILFLFNVNSVKLFSELLGRNGFGKIDMDRTETPKEG
jgi:hypothetical protein